MSFERAIHAVDRVLSVCAVLALLFCLGAWTTWVRRSDARAAEQIALAQCRAGELAYIRADGARVSCPGGGTGGSRR